MRQRAWLIFVANRESLGEIIGSDCLPPRLFPRRFERDGPVRHQIAGQEPLQQIGIEHAKEHGAQKIVFDNGLAAHREAVAWLAIRRAQRFAVPLAVRRDQTLIDGGP